MNIHRPPSFQSRLTSGGPAGTLAGGTEGQGQGAKRPAAASSVPKSILVEALDSALGAVGGMFAAALFPDSTGSRARLDEAYQQLVEAVEVFREEVPKA